jgi:dTDP-4-amino-4,6-dideoxygalactose transaminase
MTNAIPFLDLITLHRELEDELLAVVRATLRSAYFIGGPEVQGFETEFAAFCQAAHCVGVGSGTDAVRFALMAAGVGAGDVVITVPNTFIATTEAISQAGARPAFVDVDEHTLNMSPDALRDYLETHPEEPVKAVVPVHLFGQMADMDAIQEIAEDYGLIVVEDACQAHGAEYFSRKRNRWMRAGSMGRAAAFSFYPGKNLGACGEAGAVTTHDAGIAQAIRKLRDHGQAKKYYHDIEGYNGRLDALQAAMLRVKLRHLAAQNENRREAAARYRELLGSIDQLLVPFEPEWSKAVYHLYVIRVPNRDAMQKFLADQGIGTGLHYPVPLHHQQAYAGHEFARMSFPAAERACREILSLPMFPGLLPAQQERISAAIRSCIAESVALAGSR